MNRKNLIFSFIIAYLFLAPSVLAQIAQIPDISEFRFNSETPESLVNLLEIFGIPRELSVDYGVLLIYVIVPIIAFIIVLKAILVDQIMVNISWSFSGAMGWIFCVLLVIFLIPTGVIGTVAMMLYALSGVIVIYGFGFLILIEVFNYFTRDKPWWWKFIIFGIIGFFIAVVFLPALGLYVGLVIIGYSIFRAWRSRATIKAALIGLKPGEDFLRKMEFDKDKRDVENLIKKMPSKLQSTSQIDYLKPLYDAGVKYMTNAIDKNTYQTEVKRIKETIKERTRLSKKYNK